MEAMQYMKGQGSNILILTSELVTSGILPLISSGHYLTCATFVVFCELFIAVTTVNHVHMDDGCHVLVQQN